MADVSDIPLDESGRILDFLTGQPLEPKPEEFVRQRYLGILHYEYRYPKNVLAREVPIQYGSGELKDAEGNPVRADIVVYKTAIACSQRDQGNMFLVVECKREKETEGYNQLVSYIYNTSAEGGVWYNGDEVSYFRRYPQNTLTPWTGIPRFRESWDAIGRRRKDQLIHPKDVKGLLRRCHNKLHGRGSDGEEEDLAMDMLRLILAKAHDEERPGDMPEFYCTQEEYSTPQGQRAVATRVQNLFREMARLNRDVFNGHEQIGVGDRALCDVVIELQNYELLADLSSSADWDLMGHAYEQYTDVYLKRQRGQYFTNRLVVDFMISILDPGYEDIVLDPAGGSGGFLTSALRYVRAKIFSGRSSERAKQRQLSLFTKRMFMVEISRRLVKVAKTAMILNGDGHTGMTRGDSLGPYSELDKTVVANCGRGKPSIVVTNPPFAGVGEGRVRDANVLNAFKTGKRWSGVGVSYAPILELLSDGAPPELLFFERVLDWVAPDGRIGIVLPKSFLDVATYRSGRSLLFQEAQLVAVINCHKNTFQPYTGTRTCLLFAKKLPEGAVPPEDYEIFMAISRKIGQDSEGKPIYKIDSSGQPTDEVDHDLNEILDDLHAWQDGHLRESEVRFTIRRTDIDDEFKINPQAYLPDLNETIRRLEEVDQIEGWSVTALGQASSDIAIFKGPRLKSENIIVEARLNDKVEPYYTPSAVLQDKADSVKWIDVDRASTSQARTIAAIRVQRGDIVITRSGSIGRVAMITARLDNAIVSDDLIRVRIEDDNLRWYTYAYLQTKAAHDQMLRNEYGAIQQHLEPEHIKDLLIPIPDDWSVIQDVIEGAKKQYLYKEAAEQAAASTLKSADNLVRELMEKPPSGSV